jgi:hypothetical protein
VTELRVISHGELRQVLSEHAVWARTSGQQGVRANLRRVCLRDEPARRERLCTCYSIRMLCNVNNLMKTHLPSRERSTCERSVSEAKQVG